MKQKHFYLSFILIAVVVAFAYVFSDKTTDVDAETLRAQHKMALENSPFKTTKDLSKEARKDMALPPNAYNEQLWELTLDPQTGRPMPERIMALQEQLKFERQNTRGVGGDSNNPWIDRGPNDTGGRTRGIMFDPNDVGAGNGDGIDYNRVFAGGVSGGLWVNNDITNAASSWTLVPGIGANISVNIIISDPNSPSTFYIGSGESYTSGAVIGRGIWRSTDSGVTWSNVFGGYTGMSGTQLVDGVFYINDLIARNVSGNTVLYAAVAGAFNGNSDSPNQWNGLNQQGLYTSSNGTTWNLISITETSGAGTTQINPNDLELDINNNIWLATTGSSWRASGGKIFQSTNGSTFNLINTIAGTTRTEIEPSANAVGTFWIAAEVAGRAVNLYTTTNAFTSYAPMTSEPNDLDLGIPATDFTRGQAFYDLTIEADASDNLIVGGVDLFRSTDNGTAWTQISKWSNNANLNTLTNVPLVHADHHATVQRPGAGNSNKYAFGTDGGVFYSDNITTASSSAITSRNQDYSTVQFYSGAIDPVDGGDGDDLIGGTQDNGTQFLVDGAAGSNGFFDPVGGDGAYTEIDDTGLYMIQSYPTNRHRYINYPVLSTALTITTAGPDAIAAPNCNTSNGSFINAAELDKNLDILYSDASFRTFVCTTGASVSSTYRIERSAEFLPGGLPQVNTFLSDALLNDNVTAMKISPYTAGSSKLFVGLKNGRLLQITTADGTPAWSNIAGPGFVGSISDIEFGLDETEMFVTMHNYGVTSIWFTTDSGANWNSIEGNLPDLPVKCILQNTLLPNELIIGTELGVWATADYTQPSPVWFQTYNGMSDVTVIDLDVRTADDVILASTHGRGMFTSQFTNMTLSVSESSFNESSIKIYPTISDGSFTISTQRALGNVNFTLYDLTGNQIYSSKFDFSSSTKDFNLSLSAGMYLVKIESDNSKITKRIIIK